MALPMKAVFQGEFPLTAQFRSGPRNPVKSYDIWKENQFLPEGFPVDLQTNVLRFASENYDFADQFAQENPSMLMMSTWRAASGNPKGLDAEANGDPLGQSVIEFPGHFVLSPGSYLASGLSADATTLEVTDGSKMVKGPALLVATDGKGEKLWGRFEYVLIKNVNGSTITVKREFNGSPNSRSFPKKTTYVAPMPWDFRVHAEYTDWFFNYSKHCPRDPQGRTAMDVILKEMVGPLRPKAKLEHIGGLDLASGPLNLYPVNADYDLDGIADPDSVYQDGVRTFYNRVWNVLGEDRVLTTELDYQMLGFINGVNQEGLARPNDPWREVSRTVNDVLAWQRISPLPMVSLAFVQYLNKEEDEKRVQMHRLLNGYATCLGLAADVDRGNGLEALERDELFKGADKEAHWLGKRVGHLVRPAAMTPNLLIGDGRTSSNDWAAMENNIDILRADMFVEGDELVIRPMENHVGFVTLYLNFELTEKTDLTIFMEAKSDDDSLVRHIKLPRISVPVETGGVRATISNVAYVPIGYYMRGAKPGSVEVDIRFNRGGDIRIRNLSVHAATDTLACQFDQGVVLVNPSLDSVEVNLEEIFPGRTGYRRLKASAVPQSAIKDKYLPQYHQAKNLNNGQLIGNTESVQVPERNALFLIAHPSGPTLAPSSAPTSSPTTTSSPTAVVTASPTACEDDVEKFRLQSGNLVGCWYVTRHQSKKERRCSESSYNGNLVSDFCRKSCGNCDVGPTGPAPSPTPGPDCQDTSNKFELNKGTFVTCKWTKTYPHLTSRRCSETTYGGPVVSNLCPNSCGKCGGGDGDPCQDSDGAFTLQNGVSVKCLWTTAVPNKTTRRCSEITKDGKRVSNICRSSCSSC